MNTWYLLIGFGAGVALGCSGAESAAGLTEAAISCHSKTLAMATTEGTCLDVLERVETLIAKDPDCVRVFKGAGSGLHCVDHELDGGSE